jgi:hypothetical protein
MASAKAADSAVSHRTAVPGGPARSGRGGPDPPETKIGVSFLNRAATIEREGQCPRV